MKWTVCLLVCLCWNSSCQPTDENYTTADYQVDLEQLMEDQKIPALAALVARKGTIIHESYLGKTNIANNQALETNHLFLLASVSKVVTATALLQLYDRGLLAFLQALLGINNAPKLLEPATVAAMHQAQIPSLDQEMGWHLFAMDDAASWWGHEGGEEGVTTVIAFQPEEQAVVILLTNQTDATLEEALMNGFELTEQ